MDNNLPVIAGAISTTIFALSTLPMLFKAFRTKDLSSYSLGNILLANVGNLVYSVYVFDLPAGPIWLLHSFYLVTTALMLFWYLRYEWRPRVWPRVRVRLFGVGQPRKQYPGGIPLSGTGAGAGRTYAEVRTGEV